MHYLHFHPWIKSRAGSSISRRSLVDHLLKKVHSFNSVYLCKPRKHFDLHPPMGWVPLCTGAYVALCLCLWCSGLSNKKGWMPALGQWVKGKLPLLQGLILLLAEYKSGIRSAFALGTGSSTCLSFRFNWISDWQLLYSYLDMDLMLSLRQRAMPMPGHSLVPYPLDQSRSRKKLLFFSGRQSSQSGEGSPPKQAKRTSLLWSPA